MSTPSTTTLYPHPAIEIPSVSQLLPRIPLVLGELPTIDNAPTVMSCIDGAVLAIDSAPEVKLSIIAGLLPPTYGPAALDEELPGAIATVAVPQSTSSKYRDSNESIVAEL